MYPYTHLHTCGFKTGYAPICVPHIFDTELPGEIFLLISIENSKEKEGGRIQSPQEKYPSSF